MRTNLPTSLLVAGLALLGTFSPVAAEPEGRQATQQEEGNAQKPLEDRFILAILNRDAETLKACLAEGADPNRKSTGWYPGDYPLQIAFYEEWGEGMLILLDAGADPLQKGDWNTTVIVHNLLPCPIEVLPRLLEAGAMERKLFLALHNSSYEEYCEEAQRIVAEWQQVTPLMKAALAGDTPAMRRLLAEGADPSAPDKAGITPLMYAAASGKADGVELLLQAGADLHAVDICGDTALHYAAVLGCGGAARLLCQAGADITQKDAYEWPPLEVAIFKGNEEVVEALLEAGVRVTPEDAARAVDSSIILGWSVCATPLLIFNEKEPSFCEMSFVDGGPFMQGKSSATILRMLVEAGATFDAKLGAELLSRAASNDDADIVRLLLEHGVDVNAKSDRGHTALMFAELECTRILLEAGADVNARDDFGRSVLDYASGEKVKLLLEAKDKAADSPGHK